MTDIEKAKAYDEALERASIAYKDGDKNLKAILERVFPELKESEDETIRKELIEFVHQYGDNYYGQISKASAISWLEKQGNVKHTCRNCQTFQDMHQNCPYSPIYQYSDLKESHKHLDDETHCEFWIENKVNKNNRNWKPTKEQINALEHFVRSIGESGYASPYDANTNLLYSLLNDLQNLEKKGEQNKINSCPKFTFEDVLAVECSMKTAKITEGGEELYKILVPLYNKIHNAYLHQLQGEQNAADKIEPNFNFKVGQWIVAAGKCVYLITKIDGFNVTLVDINGDESVFDAGSLDDAHLWTINDTREGDVLYYKSPLTGIEYIVMSRGVNGYGNIDSYFRYHSEDGFDTNIPSVFSAKLNDITPATKEQRDLLFQKMKESGYEWDAEKKELRNMLCNDTER